MHDIFQNLFVLDIANNHQGSVEHGKNIINKMSNVVKSHNVKAAIKFQMRELNSFIHPDYFNDRSNKMVDRFTSTKLTLDNFKTLKELVVRNNLLTMCTPFDEVSAKNVIDFDFDIIKVASCSAQDWPLLEEISSSRKPIVISTGGMNINEIDHVVDFFKQKSAIFGLMHCVSIYPTPANKCCLNQIQVLKERYPNLSIGWSTHESPNELFAIAIACAKGATMFERHIGLESENISLNKYSSNCEQISKWFESFKHANSLIDDSTYKQILGEEQRSLDSLKRGIFAKKDLKEGHLLTLEDIFFAIPLNLGQLTSGNFQDKIVLRKSINKNEPITTDHI